MVVGKSLPLIINFVTIFSEWHVLVIVKCHNILCGIWMFEKRMYMIYFFLVVLRLLLDYSYVVFVSQVFQYEGFFLSYSHAEYFFSWILYFGAFSSVSSNANKVSDFFFIMAAAMLFAPLTSFYGLSGREALPVIVTLVSILMVYFIANFRGLKVPNVPYVPGGNHIALGVSIVFVAYLVLWYFISGAAFNLNFDLSKVYDFRAKNAEITNIGILSYVNNWVYQVFTIFLISYFLYARKLTLVIFCVLVQIFFFAVSSHKSLLLYPFMIVGIWFYFRGRKGLAIVPIGSGVIVALGLLLFELNGEVFYGSMMIRRVFFVPALLTYGYFDFFANNDFVYWSNSVLSFVFDYTFDDRVTLMIGAYLGSGASANNGYISSGYSHAGFFGVFVYSFILGYILKYIDVVSKEAVPLWFALTITVIPLRNTLLSSDLLTTILTHGLLVAFSLLVLMRRMPVVPER